MVQPLVRFDQEGLIHKLFPILVDIGHSDQYCHAPEQDVYQLQGHVSWREG